MFQYIKNKTLFFTFAGISDDLARKMNETELFITVKLSGDKLSVEIEGSEINTQTVELILNVEVEEVLGNVLLKVNKWRLILV